MIAPSPDTAARTRRVPRAGTAPRDAVARCSRALMGARPRAARWPCRWRRAGARRGRRAAGARALQPSAGPTRSSASDARASRRPSAAPALRRRRGLRPRPRARDRVDADRRTSHACSAWRAASRATCPRARAARRARRARARGSRATQAGARSSSGPGTFLNESVAPDRGPVQRADARQTARAQAAGRRGASALARAQGSSAAEAQAARRAGRASSSNAEVLTATRCSSRCGTGWHRSRRRSSTTRASSRGSCSTPSRPPGTPKARFAYIFPAKDGALIQVRLRAGPQRGASARGDRANPRARSRCRDWRLSTAGATSSPARRSSSASSPSSISRLDRAAARRRARRHGADARARLPGARCGCCRSPSRSRAAALTFGALALVGASLTMASIARAAGPDRPRGRLRDPAAVAGRRRSGRADRASGASAASPRAARRRSRPPRRRRRRLPRARCSRRCRWCAASACCSSPASRSRSLCALTLGDRRAGAGRAGARARGAAARSGRGRAARRRRPAAAGGAARARSSPAARVAGARARGARRGAGRGGARAGDAPPGRVARASPPSLAAAGWALDTQTRVESDMQKLVPQDLPALRDLETLQEATGVGGEIDVVVEGRRSPTRRSSRG